MCKDKFGFHNSVYPLPSESALEREKYAKLSPPGKGTNEKVTRATTIEMVIIIIGILSLFKFITFFEPQNK